MKENYSAWNINISEYGKLSNVAQKTEFIARYGVLAPSSHNSQPWNIRVSGDKTILVSPDYSRALPVADSNNRQFTESLGCCVQYVILAAEALGIKTHLVFDPKTLVSTISLDFNQSQDINKTLLEALISRHTNRYDYIDKKLPDDFLEWAKSLSTESLSVKLVLGKQLIAEFGRLAVLSEIEAMESKSFREELSHYIKSNYTNSYFGMPGFGMGLPGIVSLFVPFLIRKKNLAKLNEKNDLKKFVGNTSAFLIISSNNDTPDDWFKVGRLFTKIAVEATRLGIVTNPAAATIQIGNNYKTIQNLLRMSQRPQFFCRIGFANKNMPHSPRRPIH
ncbi:MAG: hypothetical protein AAB420_04015 [Patescibacteria group bacterium]